MSTAPDHKPSRASLARRVVRLLMLRTRLAVGCWLAGTTVAEIKRLHRLQKLTGGHGK